MNQQLPGHITYPDVFQPMVLNRLHLRNRIFVPAHTTNFGENHLPSMRHVAYHSERAQGGAAAIIFEAIRVMDNTLGRPQGVSGYLPGAVEAFAKVVQRITFDKVSTTEATVRLFYTYSVIHIVINIKY